MTDVGQIVVTMTAVLIVSVPDASDAIGWSFFWPALMMAFIGLLYGSLALWFVYHGERARLCSWVAVAMGLGTFFPGVLGWACLTAAVMGLCGLWVGAFSTPAQLHNAADDAPHRS